MANSPPSKKLKVVLTSDNCTNHRTQFLNGINIYILEQGIGKTRCNILKQQIEKNGGAVDNAPTLSTSYILVDKGMKKEKMMKILKLKKLPVEDNCVIKVDWISSCLVHGKLINPKEFQMFCETPKVSEEESHSPKRNKVIYKLEIFY